MNNRGQILVFFIILIPVLVLIAAYSIDMAHVYYRSTKLNNLNRMVLEYGLDNIKDSDIKSRMEELLIKNDADLTSYSITIKDDKINISLNKKIDSIFGKIINIKSYQISSNYHGYIQNGKTKIEKR